MQRWRSRGYDTVYGDACDQDFIGSLPLKDVKWVISAMPQHEIGVTHEDPRMMLMDALKTNLYTGKIAVSIHHVRDAEVLKAKGADLVLLPFYDAADRAVERILEASGRSTG